MSQSTDAKADGNFGSAGSHRAGYGDKLANAERWARKGGTLNAGEGLILCEEIDRLRSILAALREPSEAFIDTVVRFGYSHFHGMPIQPANFLRAAVAAAEQEASA